MFGLKPKLPIGDDDRLWIDEGFRFLEKKLGRSRLLEAEVVLPEAKYFPDDYDGSSETVTWLFERVCQHMKLDHKAIHFEIFPDEGEELRASMPYWRGSGGGVAGFYCRYAAEAVSTTCDGDDRPLVAVRSSQLRDPMSLIAVIAHELGHVILLGGNFIQPNDPTHEPLTDLLTVFLGFGIFRANSCFMFKQFQDASKQGWSVQRLGYLSEEIYGYALAKFVTERGEQSRRGSVIFQLMLETTTNARASGWSGIRNMWRSKNRIG